MSKIETLKRAGRTFFGIFPWACGIALALAFYQYAGQWWNQYTKAWVRAHARDELLRAAYAPAEYNQGKLFYGTLGVVVVGFILFSIFATLFAKVHEALKAAPRKKKKS